MSDEEKKMNDIIDKSIRVLEGMMSPTGTESNNSALVMGVTALKRMRTEDYEEEETV